MTVGSLLRMSSTASLAAVLALSSILTGSAHATPPLLSEERYLAGDLVKATATDVQEYSRIAAGGPGYLVVWEEHRPIISGVVNSAGSVLTGNAIDIYAARLDANGNPLDAGPIIISQDGQNQAKPQVAWNAAANAWLVIWRSERPDWYFFEDIVGVRVSANGQVLDSAPIQLRPETNNPSNDYAEYPTLASDGTNWLVVWTDITWSGGTGRPNLAGKRVNASGVVLDAAPVVLYQHPDPVFGPIVPHLVWATNEYLLVWERAGIYTVHGKRIGSDLHGIDAAPFIITNHGYGPRVATNGTDFLVVTRYNLAHRVTHAGVSLDPSGITIPTPAPNDFRGPDVAWNGTHYVTVNSGFSAGQASIWMARISTAGTVVGSGVVHSTGDDQYNPTVASNGGGNAFVTWGERDNALQYFEDVRGSKTDVNGVGGAIVDVSAGLHRQTYLRIAENGSERLLVYLSEGGGVKRIVAQRTTPEGQTIDAEPIEVASVGDASRIYPSVAWNGSYYLIVWAQGGSIYGRRLNASAVPVDATPVLLLSDTASAPAVAALGGNFYLAYVHTFSGDLNHLRGVQINSTTMTTIGSATQIGPGYVSSFPEAGSIGGRVFIVYEDQANHDVNTSVITGIFVDASGVAQPSFSVSTELNEDMPALSVAGDRALVSWSERESHDPSAIVGRLINADGSFRTPVFLIAEAPGEQLFSACGWDGTQFVTAWTDYREVNGIEQLRGNIWAARVDADGSVLDPGGFQVTDDPLPEDLPRVTGANGKAMIACSRLHGPEGPEVQRIGYRVLGIDAAGVGDDAIASAWQVGPTPFGSRLDIRFTGDARTLGSAAMLEIFSANGRRVAHQPMNEAGATWDGRADSGEPTGSGVYFVRVSDRGRQLLERRVVRLAR